MWKQFLTVILFAALSRDGQLARAADSAQCWEPFEIVLSAAQTHPWWALPVRAKFVHEDDPDIAITVEGFWDSGRRWIVRAALPRAGRWEWSTESDDAGLSGKRGIITVSAPTPAQIDANPNLRGQVGIARGQRYFSYADGTPFFLLADTLWAANTARCGLGTRQNGPFFQHLADRRRKGLQRS